MASPSELPLPCKTVLFALANQQFRLENQMVPGGKHKKIFAVILGEAILPFFFLVFSADLDTPCSLFIVLPTRQILYII